MAHFFFFAFSSFILFRCAIEALRRKSIPWKCLIISMENKYICVSKPECVCFWKKSLCVDFTFSRNEIENAFCHIFCDRITTPSQPNEQTNTHTHTHNDNSSSCAMFHILFNRIICAPFLSHSLNIKIKPD